MNISDADMARIRARHSDIPQDPLPDVAWPEPTGGAKGERRAYRGTPSTRFARCPKHVAPGDGLTGVIPGPGGIEVFRAHTKRVGSRTIPCSGSGSAAPPPEPEASP